MTEASPDVMTDAEIVAEVEKAEKLGRELIRQFEGYRSATVLQAIAVVIAHAVRELSVPGTTVDMTFDMLRACVDVEMED